LYDALVITNVAIMPYLYRSNIITGIVRQLLSEGDKHPVLATEAANFSPLPAFEAEVGKHIERLVATKEFNRDIITDGTYLLFV
jgi:hypothetical protein